MNDPTSEPSLSAFDMLAAVNRELAALLGSEELVERAAPLFAKREQLAAATQDPR